MKETKLWDTLRGALKHTRGPRYTRIETGEIQAGVADVEYVHTPWHGWIELKVGISPTARHGIPGGSLRLQHAFSLAQWAWLISHDDPRHFLRSWLLVGIRGHTGRWNSFLLLTPPAAGHLLEGREHRMPYQLLLAQPGVQAYKQAKHVLEAIAQVPAGQRKGTRSLKSGNRTI